MLCICTVFMPAPSKPKLYSPRHPERTVLYQTIAEHFVETAAHLTDHVFPRQPVRQWVLSVPKRLRYFMQRDGAVLNMVLRIFLRKVCRPTAAPGIAQVDKAALHIGAVAFIHRFGSSLNAHVHFHVCVVDGVFEVVAGEEKSKPNNCNWPSRNQPFVAVGFRCQPDAGGHSEFFLLLSSPDSVCQQGTDWGGGRFLGL